MAFQSTAIVTGSRFERGLHHFKVWQTVYKGKQSERLPVLYIIDSGGARLRILRLDALVDYLFDNSARSGSWMLDIARTVGFLIDFVQAWLPFLRAARNRSHPEASHDAILKRFVRSYLNGTRSATDGVSVDGMGLYWLPKPQRAAKKSLLRLTEFLRSPAVGDIAWRTAVDQDPGGPMVAIRIAHQRVIQKNKSLLAHLADDEVTLPSGRHLGGLTTALSGETPTYRFPIKYIWQFLFQGFQSKRTKQADETAQLVAFLLFAGGGRCSEYFHAWVQDVQFVGNEPIFVFHHPRDGMVVDEFGRRMSRAEHLLNQPRARRPRNTLRKRGHAGFKGLAEEAYGAQLIWLPVKELVEEISTRLRHYIFVTRPRIMALRKGQGLPDHNYLFVGTGQTFASNTNEIGAPYTLEAFRSAWNRAIARTSVICNEPELTVAKHKGTTPHAARHFYGSFLKSLGCSSEDITGCMHHKSPFSALKYTALTPAEMNEIIHRRSEGNTDLASMATSVAAALKRRAANHRP